MEREANLILLLVPLPENFHERTQNRGNPEGTATDNRHSGKKSKMNYLNDPRRAYLLETVRCADTLSEVEKAIAELRQWIQQYPEDIGIRDAFEPLSHRKDFLLAGSEVEAPVVTTRN
jgi:hypothetical protein